MKRLGVAAIAAALAVLAITAVVRVAPVAAAGVAEAVAHGGGGRGGHYSEAGLAAAAEMLGMTVDDLRAQLRAGESLADLAEEAGVDLQALLDTIDAANVQATRDAIAAAVTAGTLTQAKADWLNEGLDNGFWGPGVSDSFGFGGRGLGFGGRGRGSQGITPTVTATPGADS
jgi:hypothetical protein